MTNLANSGPIIDPELDKPRFVRPIEKILTINLVCFFISIMLVPRMSITTRNLVFCTEFIVAAAGVATWLTLLYMQKGKRIWGWAVSILSVIICWRLILLFVGLLP